ncbi:shikimate kinase [Chamaesiphon sp. VAR_69_metabat_338]|uniref:shikimate kinase n=1 Tax=Chamaesiphon sp. VAR_69_metabat_338 TaxID=2964704 RepID=UPI00286E5A26|nr:shikimate kinase [Chamaesiphon sp. VAR_69_metabat_338]
MFDLQGLNIYLIGMMGCGKSTIGPLLAAKLGYSFLDTDTTIEQLVSQSISELFTAIGEPEFRKVETQVLAEVSAHIRLVVSTGGGIAIARENWNHLHQGLVIWLDPSIDILVERLQGDTSRPILASSDLRTKLEGILAERRHMYAEADIHLPIATKLAPEEIVDRILAAIPTVLKTPSITPD